MPSITEEDETMSNDIDFSQLGELPEATFADLPPASGGAITTADDGTLLAFDSTFAHSSADQWPTLLGQPTDPTHGLEEPDYSRFEDFIPSMVRVEKPCDYCRSKRLACYMYGGDLSCTACKSLFRECSLNATTMEAFNYADKPFGTLLDTLHTVDEDVCRERGTSTGVKALASKNRMSGTSTPVYADDAPGSSKRNGIRFPKNAVKVLREWLDAHANNPYPTEKEKADLEQRTELKPSQIANWLANARRRRKATGRSAQPRIGMSPSLQASTPAIAIPEPDKPWDELNPFERWKHSPPEHEPARMTDIANAVAHSDIPVSDISRSPSSGRRKRSSNGSGFSSFRERDPSTTSFDTSAQTSSLSTSSAKFSHGSSHSHGSFGSFSSGLAGKKDRKRRRRPAALSQRPTDDKKRVFQCTFCTDTFKSKYDWTRHEKSLHLSLEKWICAPLGPVISDPASGQQKCVYCDALDPSEAHIEGHNHRQCEDKGLDSRTFYRKDHVRQHLRLMHGCDMIQFHDTWKFTAVQIKSRCGFCAKRFSVWQERVDHLTAHFKAGAKMAEWKGCRGLDPAVAAQVTNAMPPYLIGIESVSPNPFSATNEGTWRYDTLNMFSSDRDDPTDLSAPRKKSTQPGFNSRTTCWEILTVRLGKYANKMAQEGLVITDEMLQRQARRILYDSDDSWNQTAADNPEWLDLFKKAHGLDFIPNAIGGEGRSVPDDPEYYSDLGLRIPFAVQLRAYNSVSARTSMMAPLSERPKKTALAQECRSVYAQLSQEGVLHDEDFHCHEECRPNVVDVSIIDDSDEKGPRYRRWCGYQLPVQTIATLSSNAVPLPDDAEAPCSSEHVAITSGGETNDVSWQTAHEQFNTDIRSMRTEGCHFMSGMRSLQALKTRDKRNMQSASARATALMNLSRIEAAEWDDCVEPNTVYTPYHKHELPDDRARLFATITGAWEDSGMMPTPHSTEPPGIENQHKTTTGAMVEFLGGDLAQNLPFSNDVTTSTIPITTAQQEALDSIDLANLDPLTMEDIDDFITATTQSQENVLALDSASAVQADSYAVPESTETGDAAADLPMADTNIDDMDFDAIFDMHIEDDYVGAGNTLA